MSLKLLRLGERAKSANILQLIFFPYIVKHPNGQLTSQSVQSVLERSGCHGQIAQQKTLDQES